MPACSPTTTTLAANLLKAADESGDKLWRLPLGEAYDRLIDSPDRRHEECRPARGRLDHRRAVPQALRRERHALGASRHRRHGLDRQGRPTYDKGATGYGVRLLDQYVADSVEG